jgi:hypothetical protein
MAGFQGFERPEPPPRFSKIEVEEANHRNALGEQHSKMYGNETSLDDIMGWIAGIGIIFGILYWIFG